jgi:hypothetical protein
MMQNNNDKDGTILNIIDVVSTIKPIKEYQVTDDKMMIEFSDELYLCDIEILNSVLKNIDGYKEFSGGEFYINKNMWNTVSLKLK